MAHIQEKSNNDLKPGGERGDGKEGSWQGGGRRHGGLEGEPSHLNDGVRDVIDGVGDNGQFLMLLVDMELFVISAAKTMMFSGRWWGWR